MRSRGCYHRVVGWVDGHVRAFARPWQRRCRGAALLCVASSCRGGDVDPSDSSTASTTTATSSSDAALDPGDTEAPYVPPPCVPQAAFGTWSELMPMAEARAASAIALAPDGDLIVTGGASCSSNDDEGSSTGERLDRDTWTWSAIAAMPSARKGHVALALPDGAILVIGGQRDADASGAVDRYDPYTDTWRTVGALPEPSFGVSAVLSTDGSIVVKPQQFPAPSGTWFVSSDFGVTWIEFPHGSTAFHGYLAPDLLALPDGRILATAPGGATVFDAADGTWWDPDNDPPWPGGAARLDGGEALVISTRYAAEQAPVGGIQMETSAALFDPATGTREHVGYADCPSASGKLEHLAARAYGADIAQIVAITSDTTGVWFDRDDGWRWLARLPNTASTSAKVLLDDGSFVLVGGTNPGEFSGNRATAATFRWVADG